MGRKKKEFVHIIKEILNEQEEVKFGVTLGELLLVWAALPITLELSIFYFFGIDHITPETAWILVVPSIVLSLLYWAMKNTRIKWWNKII